MSVDRLSALDECFLRMETGAAHMHVGWTLLLRGEPPSVAELRAHVASRLELLPRLRRRLLSAPLHLHDPVWSDDPEFEIEQHVGHTTAPGGLSGLRRAAGTLLSMPLDRSRPLWRMHLLDGVGEDRFAIVGVAHHALVDGVAAVEVARLLLDPEPGPSSPLPQRRFAPAPAPGIIERVRWSGAQRVRLTRSLGSAALRVATDPAGALEAAGELRRAGGALAALGAPAPATALNRAITPERAVAFAELPLSTAKEIGRRRDATVGDVVLCVSTLALGRFLRRAGEAHPWLRALVPVSTRGHDADGELGNQVSMMFVELPVGERDPLLALAEVARQTGQHKRAAHPAALDRLLRGAAVVPARFRDLIAWLMTRPQAFNAVVSNLPGSREPLYLLGRRLQAAYPAVPLTEGHGLSVGIVSYCGVLHVGLCADPWVVPGVLDLSRDFVNSFETLRRAVLPPAPWTPSRPARPKRRVAVLA
jgi:diacylglycerol O-acyltransferase / wax synthase